MRDSYLADRISESGMWESAHKKQSRWDKQIGKISGSDYQISCTWMLLSSNTHVYGILCVCPRQVSATGQLVSSGAAAITSRATFVSIDSVECMLEQSVCGSSRAIGAWSVTVSNNGALQSTQSLLYVIYDSNCFTCTSTSCSPRVHTVFWIDIWF